MLSLGLSGADDFVVLWPDGAVGKPTVEPVETVIERSTDPALPDRALSGVSRPRMAVFRPKRPNGAAVLVMPGGGYRHVVVDHEGYDVARWLAHRGFAAFVLFYRLPGDGWAHGANVALSDAQRAMRLIRARADEFAIKPDRVAAMGFSAGGHLCADLATRFDAAIYDEVDTADRASARPLCAATIYPVVSMSLPDAHGGSRQRLLGRAPNDETARAHSPDRNVPANAPPFFIVHAEDDRAVSISNALALRAALQQRSIPVDTHLFAHGGHGFGLRKAAGKSVAAWPELWSTWARKAGLA